jgi:polysaccharide chain length determinant protein (PEP-CTERM system associated)
VQDWAAALQDRGFMKDIVVRLYDEARSAWRFRWIGLAIASAIALLGWGVVLSLPDRYEATSSVFVDTRTALRPALQGLTVEQDVSVQLNFVRQSLLSGESLLRIARRSEVLAADVEDPREIAEVLDAFFKRIKVDVRNAGTEREPGGTVYSFTYQDEDRDRALKAIEVMVNTFIEDTLGGRRSGVEGAQRFLEEQIKDYESRLRTAENRLAEFKKSNVGLMPTEQGGYFERLQAEIDAADKLQNDLALAESRRAELNRQLRGEAAISGTASANLGVGGATAPGSDTLARIKETQARIDELLQKYTDKHPDVIAAQNTLRELEARRNAEIESLRRGDLGAAASSGASANPVYQSILLQLNQAEVEITSLRGQLAQRRAKAAELRQRLDIAPQVEAEFAQLNRDYDTNKAQYTALLASYEKTQLGERADSAGSVRFEKVQPATSPYVPVAPKRLLLLIGTLLAALGAGGAVAFFLHLFNPVIGSLQSLSELIDAPVLGVVSSAFPDRLWQEAKGELYRFLGASSVLVLMFMAVVWLSLSGFRLGLMTLIGGDA